MGPAIVTTGRRCPDSAAARRAGQRGFTLIELLIVMTLIVVLAGIKIQQHLVSGLV